VATLVIVVSVATLVIVVLAAILATVVSLVSLDQAVFLVHSIRTSLTQQAKAVTLVVAKYCGIM